MMSVIPPDYDSDPGRWKSWESPQDVHEVIAPDLRGPVLDAGCGEGRLASLLGTDVWWIGVDSSPTQLAANPYRPVVQADIRELPFRDGAFAEVTHLWCLYHLADPVVAITEAARVLVPGGRYFACCAARTNDPEIMWDRTFFSLQTREDVRAYCRHNYIPLERAEHIDVPLWLTKRGVLVRAIHYRTSSIVVGFRASR